IDLPAQLPLTQYQLQQFADELLKALAQPYAISGHYYSSSVSLGYCVFNDTSVSADELLKRADIAVSHAKAAGGNCQVMFEDEMYQQIQQRFAMENALAKAVEQNQLSLHYQPQLTDTGRVVGLRRCCAGIVRSWAWYHRPSLSRWPRKPG
ncbi:diguanylate cyclase, partial [Rheinheimera sp.]|uniref:diguanylate cyclase domain-containing protein n=1 Tax=Rheinheimera sp. TaxID=1869214 RepID=UPI002353CA96